MRWIRRNKWPRLGIVGFFGGPHRPITAAIPPATQETFTPPQPPCQNYGSQSLFLTVSGVSQCPCTPIDDSPGFSQSSIVSPNGVWECVPVGTVLGVTYWNSTDITYSFFRFSGDDCDTLIEEIDGTFYYQLRCFPNSRGLYVATVATGGQEFFLSNYVIGVDTGEISFNDTTCSNSGNATHGGQATIST